MKTRASIIATAVAVSGLALSLPAAAAPERNLPAAHKEGAVTYISGGVGQQEADAMKHVAKYYPLELEFLQKAKLKDEYLSGVKVRIRDEHNKMVLNVTSDGPFLLAKLPAGRYTVSAERNHDAKNREVQIVAKENRRVVFEWQS
jgi:hypothetical protein